MIPLRGAGVETGMPFRIGGVREWKKGGTARTKELVVNFSEGQKMAVVPSCTWRPRRGGSTEEAALVVRGRSRAGMLYANRSAE